MIADLRRLIADATDALNCAELLDRRGRTGHRRDHRGKFVSVRALRDEELDRAAAYIDRAKAELALLQLICPALRESDGGM